LLPFYGIIAIAIFIVMFILNLSSTVIGTFGPKA
jgi:hypothetical protein